jgi:hypothetical protein
MLALQLGEERHCLEPRIGDKPRFDGRPNVGEGVWPGAPSPWRTHPRGASQPPLAPSRFLIHAAPPGRLAQSHPFVQPPRQQANLTVRDHATPS